MTGAVRLTANMRAVLAALLDMGAVGGPANARALGRVGSKAWPDRTNTSVAADVVTRRLERMGLVARRGHDGHSPPRVWIVAGRADEVRGLLGGPHGRAQG